MFGSVERYSSATRRKRAGIFWSRTLRVVFIAFLLYLIISRLFVTSFRVDSISMAPTLNPSDKILVSVLSYGAYVPFTAIRFPGIEKPKRGDLAVVAPPFSGDVSAGKRLLQPFVSFFSFQKATLARELDGSLAQEYVVKRIVGIPGDTVRMQNYTVTIRPKGSPGFLAEDQLPIGAPQSSIKQVPGWKPEFPFSGNIVETVLQNDQYFVLGDDRANSSDSRSWGPVSLSRIYAKVILRYWPPADFGKL
jgi:signal peptidase I